MRIIRDNARKALGRAPGTKLFYFILGWGGMAATHPPKEIHEAVERLGSEHAFSVSPGF